TANEFLTERNLRGSGAEFKQQSSADEILQKTLRHLQITFISLLLAIIIALPLGILLSAMPAAARPVLYVTGLLQTIPSI
ncbi:hypothetical protein SB775_33305, partial [Peribacillus sp. SIMBA_075]